MVHVVEGRQYSEYINASTSIAEIMEMESDGW